MEHYKLLIVPLLMMMALGLSACAPKEGSPPQSWIDSPQKGAQIQVGETIMVISHTYADAGVGEVLLTVNGQAYSRDAFSDVSKDFDIMHQKWTPTEAGDYLLQVRPYDAQGRAGRTDAIAVNVVAHIAEATTAPAQPSPTTLPPSATATSEPTTTPTPSPTNTPIPPTNTPIPPTATPIPPTPTPIPPTATPIPPTNTPAPTSTPVDVTAPPAPIPMVPADGLTISCRSEQMLAWLPVNDPSGIAGYYLLVEQEIKKGNWGKLDNWGPIHDKQFMLRVNCGVHYRWKVRAKDGAGNTGNWSEFSYFTVNLN